MRVAQGWSSGFWRFGRTRALAVVAVAVTLLAMLPLPRGPQASAGHLPPEPRVLRYTMLFETSGQSMWGPGRDATPSGSREAHVWTETWSESRSVTQIENIDIQIADYDFGGRLVGSTAGFYDAWSTIEVAPGSVSVTYPVEVTLTIPQDQSYATSETITIDSAMVALPGASLAVASPEGVLDALWTREGSASLRATVCLFECSTSTVFSGAFPEETFTVLTARSRTEPTHVNPESIWALGGLSGYARVPNLGAQTASVAADGRSLVAESSDIRFAELVLDGDGIYTKKLGYCGKYKGATLCADAVDISLYQTADQYQRYVFTPKLKVVLDFPQTILRQADGFTYIEPVPPIGFTERDPAGNIVASGASHSVVFSAGNRIDLTFPADVTLEIQPRFILDNTFTNESTTHFAKNVKLRALEAHLDVPKKKVTSGFTVTPEVCTPLGCTPAVKVPETWSPPFDIDLGPLYTRTVAPDVDNATDSLWMDGDRAPWPLDGFAPVSGAPFTMTPNLGVSVVAASGPPTNIANEGDLLEFRSAAISKDGDVLINSWEFGDGYTVVGPVVQHAFGDNTVASPGNENAYMVWLSTDDGHGAACPRCASWPMVIRNVAPTVDLRLDRALVNPTGGGFEPIGATVPEGSPIVILPRIFDRGVLDTHTWAQRFGDGRTDVTGSFQLQRIGTPGQSGYGAMLDPTSMGTSYADDGTYTYRLTVCDDDGGCGSDSTTFTVVNIAPEVVAAEGPVVGFGRPVQIEVARFFDVGLTDTHTAFISWGDGTTSSGAEVTITGAPVFDPVKGRTEYVGVVRATHTYDLRGPRNISVCVTDDDFGTHCDGGWLNVAMTMDTVPDAELDEGDTLALAAVRFTDLDPASEYTGNVNWGDSNQWFNEVVAVSTLPGGRVTGAFAPSHTYPESGVFDARVGFGTNEGDTMERFRVTVHNLPPVVTVGADVAGFVDVPLRIPLPPHDTSALTFSDPGVFDTHTLTVDWGDDSDPSSYALGQAGALAAQHVYARASIYPVTFCVADDEGADDCGTLFAHIRANTAPAVTVTRAAGGGIDADEGSVAELSVEFVDPDVGDTHVVTVDWGDGSDRESFPDVFGPLAVTHRYVSNGSYQVVVTVNDGIVDGTASVSVLVANVAPDLEPLTLSASAIDEDGTITLALAFADPGLADTHTVHIDWGDGGPPEAAMLDPGARTYTATHRYLDDPAGAATTYVVSASVSDGDAENTASAELAVANVTPAIETLTLSAEAIDEGGEVTFDGTFTDAGTLDAHTLTIDWGDGRPLETLTLAANARAFSATHRFVDNPTGASAIVVTVRISDDDGGTDSASRSVTVANVAPTFDTLSVNAEAISEGSGVTVTATFTDAGADDTHRVRIDWGDGSAVTDEVLPMGATSVLVTHLYEDDPAGDDDRYAILVTLIDDDGGEDVAAATVTVTNEAPGLRATGAEIDEGDIATLDVSVRDPGARDKHALTVDWGDGSAPETLQAPLGTFPVGHRFDQDGTYQVVLTVRDDDGGTDRWTVTVGVANVAPYVSLPDATAAEGAPVTATPRIADPGTADTHTATIDWGDGTPLEDLGAVTTGTTLSHVYADDGVYVATLTVADDDTATVTTSTITVTNVAPELTVTTDASAISSGRTLSVQARFTDPGLLDVHTATIDWGDGVMETVTVTDAAGHGTFAATHRYTAARHYTIAACVADDDVQVCRVLALDVSRLAVAIDLKQRAINARSKGNVKVELPRGGALADGTVLPESVRFGATGTEAAPTKSKIERNKVELSFDTQALGLVPPVGQDAVVTLTLTGALADGTEFIGTDSVRVKAAKVRDGVRDDDGDDGDEGDEDDDD